MKKLDNRNRIFFGLGTIGRDMFYAFEANALMYFLSNILKLPRPMFIAAGLILTILRIFDAFNDPITGMVIDNIRSPWGKFKPAIAIGGILSAIFYVLLFSGIGTGWAFLLVFGLAYLIWDVTFGINDIGYWTLLPVLSPDQKVREKIGSFSRVCACIGAFAITAAWQPVTQALGNTPTAWFWCAVVLAGIYLLGLLFPLLGVKEPKVAPEKQESTSLRQMFDAVTKNDQLLWTTLAIGLFMIGYNTTIGLAIYYMQYVFGNKDMYTILAVAVGVGQLGMLSIFPFLTSKMTRRTIFTIGSILMVIGYVIFFFAEVSLVLIVIGALLVFMGQALVQALTLMFLSDSVEYGYWKLGKKNESVTFSLQPLINKIGGAVATGITFPTLVISGIVTDSQNFFDIAAGQETDAIIDAQGQLIVKIAMFAIPLLTVIISYVIYMTKFKIDEKFYAQILKDLEQREQLQQ